MERINLANIDLRKLSQINSSQHLESDLYHDDELVYKIFKDFSEYKIRKKQKKIEILRDGNPLPNVVMPIDDLFFNDAFFGYTMKYIKNSLPLADFNKISKDIRIFFQILITVSKSVEEIHSDPREIIIGDLNFDNIIIDRSFNPYIVDFDSSKIGRLLNETNPAIIASYQKRRNIKNIDINQNSDKFSLLLWTLFMIFKKNLADISLYEIDEKAERLETLKNAREFILTMKKSKDIPEVPYIHELISNNDLQTSKSVIQVKTRKRI